MCLTLSPLRPAHAQGGYPGGGADSYAVAYSGGSTASAYTSPSGSSSSTTRYSGSTYSSAPGAWGGGGFTYIPPNGSGYVTCGGTITAAFTWNGGPHNDPPPPPGSVIVAETANAAWGGPGCGGGSDIPGGTVNPNPGSGPNYTATRYTVHGGSTFAVNCTPYASMSGSAPINATNGGDGYVGYTATPISATLILQGPVKDSQGNLHILIGQHCGASMAGLPSGSGWTTTYQWSVSGPTFQTWSADTPANGNNPYNPDASYYVGGPGPLTNPMAGWYWDETGNGTGKPETVSCTATVTPPAGQGSGFTVTISQTVKVWVPSWTCKGIGGEVDVNNLLNGGGNSNPSIYADATPTELQFKVSQSGMTWSASVSAPPAPIVFGSGSLELAQVIQSIDYTYRTNTLIPITHNSPSNGQEGLDTSWPYGWVQVTTTNPLSPSYISSDSPGMNLTNGIGSAGFDVTFEDYLMYAAPGSSQYVPLGYYVWRATGNASIPATNNWANFTANPVGTVTDSNTWTSFLPGNEFPMWSQIISAVSF